MRFTAAPDLQTERLVLRAYRLEDFEAFASYYASPRSRFTDGPVSRQAAWDMFTGGAGRWLIAGHGAWAIERRTDGAAVGLVSLNTAIDLPEPELGWILWDGFEGQGYAVEAARTALEFAFHSLDWSTLLSGISHDNARSIQLAERLGATPAPDVQVAGENDTVFYRHTRSP